MSKGYLTIQEYDRLHRMFESNLKHAQESLDLLEEQWHTQRLEEINNRKNKQ